MAIRAQESRRRRAAVFAATWEIVESDGFASVTLRQVAERAGVALGTIFLYASNKDELLLRVYGERLAARWDAFLQASENDSPVHRVESFYRDCLTMFLGDVENIGAYYALLLRYPAARFAEVADLRAGLRRILRAGEESLHPDTDAVSLEQAYYAVFAMTVMEHMHTGDEGRTRSAMDRTFALLRRGAAAPPVR